MPVKVWHWFTARWPFYALQDMLLDEKIPGGASFAFTLGSGLLMLITLQIVSGILQLFYYVPTIDHAYDSVSYLRTEVPFGWLVHNIHYWGANVMVVLAVLHVVRVYIWGGYKTQLTWLIGVGLLMMIMGMTFTGGPLIWDQKGYWAGVVGSSIAGTVPIVGGISKIILRGGETMGQLALSRYFTIHIGLIFPAMLILAGAHMAAFRKTGIVGPWDMEKRKKTDPFWPDQAFKDIIVVTTLIFIVITLCVFVPPPFTGPADPSNTTYLPKPEWNFLFLYQILKYFEGPLELVGTVGVPNVLIGLLVILPFIDRSPERNPLLRPIAMTCLVVYAGFIITLTIIGYLSPGFAQMPVIPKQTAQTTPVDTRPAQSKQVMPNPAESDTKAAAALHGADLFKTAGCLACHAINGAGGTGGPALSGETLKGRDRRWLTDQLVNPKSHFPDTIMPSFKSLPEKQVNELVDYLLSLGGSSAKISQPGSNVIIPAKEKKATDKTNTEQGTPKPASNTASDNSGEASEKYPGQAAYIIGSAENGELLFKDHCASCHGQKGQGAVPNPGSDEGTVPSLNPADPDFFNSDQKIFARNIDIVIQHGSMPPGQHPALQMQPFGDSRSLTQQEIANIEAYVLSLSNVDRTRLVNPGMQPLRFFFLSAVIFAVMILILGGVWNRRFRRCD